MQILRKTDLEAFRKARELGPAGVISLLKEKGLSGRGGAAFPVWKKWEYTLNAQADEKFVLCNADEGEPGTFKDKFIIKNNPETLIEGILIAAQVIGATRAFIYLRGEYEHLRRGLERVIDSILKESKSEVEINIVVGAGAYVCGEETAIIKSIEGFRGQPYFKPPYPPVEGLWGKPTIVNNVETLANVPQAILFDDWIEDLRLFSLSGNVTKPGIYELTEGTNLSELIALGKPKNRIKAVYFGCFGGCMPYAAMELSPEKVCVKNCAIGSYSIIAVDEKQSILDVALSVAEFYAHESCGKCTPCREGTIRIWELLEKIKKKKATNDDIDTLKDLAEQIRETSLCGLGQTATTHVLTALAHFRNEFVKEA